MGRFSNLGKRFIMGNPNRPDATADDIPKTEPKRFFFILKLHLNKVVSVNLLYCLFMLPMLAWIGLNIPILLSGEELDAYMFMFVLILAPLTVLKAPFLAGLSYISSRFVRNEHVFLWTDFWGAVKENWKTAMLLQGFSAGVAALAYFSLRLYIQMGAAQWLTALCIGVLLLVFLLISLMNMYLVPMCVRFEMRARDIIRNSFLLAIAKLPMCAVLCLIMVLPVLIFLVYPPAILFVGLYYIVIGFGLKHFLRAYFDEKVFKQYMMPKDEAPEEASVETK